ncbi:MAG: hypothetical protein RL095_1161 [Verrucomicrobiota bacterium]|jgi:stearoyl-CoA desaturase (delta-9 desaturase)
MNRVQGGGDAVRGALLLDMGKLLRHGGGLAAGLAGLTLGDPGVVLLALACCGWPAMALGVVAVHRLLIHRSFETSLRLERLMLLGASLSGMGGPLSLIRVHDLREWAQTRTDCAGYFKHSHGLCRDAWEQLFCRFELADPPRMEIAEESDRFLRLLERHWLLLQLPLGLLLWQMGSWSAVAGGVGLKLFVLPFLHWLFAWQLHRRGTTPHRLPGVAVQGRDLGLCAALITLGESYHNRHHRYPSSPRNSSRPGEIDLSWLLIHLLIRLGWARTKG